MSPHDKDALLRGTINNMAGFKEIPQVKTFENPGTYGLKVFSYAFKDMEK
jgi:hypothetical protein